MKLLSLIEISVETALLIVILQGIRVIFRKQLHPNIRYALWLFVALRILIPFKLEIPVALPQYMTYVPFVNSFMERQENAGYYRNLFAGKMEYEAFVSSDNLEGVDNDSVFNGQEEVRNTGFSDDQRKESVAGSSGGQRDAKNDMSSEVTGNIRNDNAGGIQDSKANTVIVNYDKSVDSESDSSPKKVIDNYEKKSDRSIVYIVIRILYVVWLLGILVMSVYVLIGNIRMDRYLRKERKELRILPNGLKVYEVQGYNCLFGILHPAIYVSGRYSGWKEQEADHVQGHITDQKKEINQEQVSDKQIMEYVISHESEHYRVKDHIWQMVRILCLILQWFNPFVWWAYRSSKQDCELACDYRTTKGMDREERYTYGESLLAVLESNLTYRNRLTVATSMGEQKRFLSERIRNIMNRPTKKHMILTAGIVAVLMAGCIISVSLYVKNQSGNREIAGNQEDSTGQQNTESITGMSQQNTAAVVGTAKTRYASDVNVEDYYITNTGVLGAAPNLYYIDNKNVLWGYGSNEYGQLGRGFSDYYHYDNYEDRVKIAENVIHVDASQTGFMIYLTEDHKLYGVGNKEGGALLQFDEFDYADYHNANPPSHAVSTPVLLMENVKYARCGREDIVCMMEDNSVWIWGMIGIGGEYSWWGEPQNVNFEPTPIKVLENAVLVTGGFFSHAALLKDGSVWTWGYNYTGNCGIDGMDVVSRPTKVAENAAFVWTSNAIYDVDMQAITEYSSAFEGRYIDDNTVIQKEDGSYLICGANVGTEEVILPVYYEAVDIPMVCTSKFTDFEEASAEYPDFRLFMQQVLKSQEERERKKPPTQEEVELARAQALAGMTEEEIAEFKSYVKNENQLWENRYFSNFFSDIEDPNSMMWNVLEESGDVQCGWAEELDSNGNIVGRVPVIAYNEKSADMCVEELEQYYDMVQSDTLKQDIEDLIYNYRMAKDTHRWEYAAEIFHMYHDMDYYLLRYGREDVGKYTMDQSFVSRYYGVLHEYDRQQNVSLASVMQTPQPTNLDAVNVYVSKAPIYPELDEELLEQQLNRTRWIDDMIREDVNLPLHGCEGYYIVTIPVIYYNAESNQYAVDGNYLVFDDITDLGNNAGLQAVLSEDGSAQTCGFISGLIPKYLTEVMIANPDQEYIFLYNGTAMCMIDENNTLYTSPYSDELQVVGDYYHALDYKNISVSYRNLTDSAHLLYYRDDDSDGSYVRQALPD